MLKKLTPRQKILTGYAAAALICGPTISRGQMSPSNDSLSIGHLVLMSALVTSAITGSFKGLAHDN